MKKEDTQEKISNAILGKLDYHNAISSLQAGKLIMLYDDSERGDVYCNIPSVDGIVTFSFVGDNIQAGDGTMRFLDFIKTGATFKIATNQNSLITRTIGDPFAFYQCRTKSGFVNPYPPIQPSPRFSYAPNFSHMNPHPATYLNPNNQNIFEWYRALN